SLSDVAVQGAERFLMPDSYVRDTHALATALLDDNRKREGSGRKPLFAIEAETVSLVSQPEPSERVPIPRGEGASELRRSGLGAQSGMGRGPGDVTREARGEAGASGQLPVLLVCGEAMAEAMVDATLGVRVVAVPDVDESYFRASAEVGAQEESVRRARREER